MSNLRHRLKRLEEKTADPNAGKATMLGYDDHGQLWWYFRDGQLVEHKPGDPPPEVSQVGKTYLGGIDPWCVSGERAEPDLTRVGRTR